MRSKVDFKHFKFYLKSKLVHYKMIKILIYGCFYYKDFFSCFIITTDFAIIKMKYFPVNFKKKLLKILNVH